MSSAPWPLKNECMNPQCQHEKDSHHHGKDNCLVLHCDCVRFYKKGEFEASKKKPAPPPYVDDVDDGDCPDTPRMPGWPFGSFP